ncbi:MAG: hypothetical protein H0V88_14455 [Pyrinomonadaceae bacterium]|nr:hypothetical protein [Pyrinomonadaceae bacterium]
MRSVTQETRREPREHSRKTSQLITTLIVTTITLTAILLVYNFHLTSFSFASRAATPSAASMRKFPQIVLWAWERPEQLTFIDPRTTGVAFLAETIFLTEDKTIVRPRLQPLRVAPGARLIAVTRIETDRRKKHLLSAAQRSEAVNAILESVNHSGIEAVQLDFDARDSEREFYRELIFELRQRLPTSLPLSITTLASRCAGDEWLKGLPVDEVVPMIFRMGADAPQVRGLLAAGEDFKSAPCRSSLGISADEPLPPNSHILENRRIYIFNPRSWSPETFARIAQEVHKR